MDQDFAKTAEQAAAFQKLWVDSASKIVQAAFTITPNSPPPEIMRQIRAGIFQALASSWEEFMRSPQFLKSMKQWMDNAISFRKMTNDFMAKVRNEMQAASKDDIDQIMLSIRHLEKRLLDRIDQLAGGLDFDHLRAPIGHLAPRKQVTEERLGHEREVDHHAEDPDELARLAVGAVHEPSGHVQVHADEEGRRAG